MAWGPGRRRWVTAIAAGAIGLLATLGTAGAEDVARQENWRRLDSPHFQVIGNAGERDLRRVAEQFEQFREAMALLFPDALQRADLPTRIVVFRNHKAYTPFKPLYNGKPVEVGGYFQGGPDINYITLTTENLDDNLRVIYHEFVHLIVNTAHASVPVWFNEGLAEYYTTFATESGGRKVSLGRPVVRHVHTLREQFMPLAELVVTDHRSPHYNEGDKRSIFYAESWALMHYLLLGNDMAYAPNVGTFVGRLAAGTPFEQASREVLGVAQEDLDKELRRYVQRPTFVSQIATLPERLTTLGKLPVTPLPEAEVHAALGALLTRLDRRDEARAQLAHALALDGASVEAHAALGLLHLRNGDRTVALDHLRQAADGEQSSFLTHFYYAQGLDALRTSTADPAESADYSRRMEVALRKAIELRPGFTESYHLLAYLKSLDPTGIDEALVLMGQALQRAPGREQYLLTTASLHANRERYNAAKAIAQQLALRAADAGVQLQAQEMVRRIAAFERQKSQAAAVGAAPVDPSAYFAPTTANTATHAARFIPDLRMLAAGERRTYGYLVAIDCAADGSVVLRVDDGTVAHRAAAATFDAVEFISYRTDLEGQIPCGPRAAPQAVYLTSTPSSTAGEGIIGTAVAIEFLPDGFVPPDSEGPVP